jgi:hypothetical protein
LGKTAHIGERDVVGNALANMVERLSALVSEMQRSGGQVERPGGFGMLSGASRFTVAASGASAPA